MKNKEYYLSLKYPIIVLEIWDEDEERFIYSAEIKELPGLKVYGDSTEEVLEDIQEAKSIWIEHNLELERVIPEPIKEEEASGRVTLRLPKALHASLKRQALEKEVNLNPLLNDLIIKGLQENTYNDLIQLMKEIKKENLEFKNEVIRRFNLIDHYQQHSNYNIPGGHEKWEKQNNISSKGILSHY